jgi:hypothetical protein
MTVWGGMARPSAQRYPEQVPNSNIHLSARILLPVSMVTALAAQPAPKPFQAQSPSSIALSVKNDASVIEIANVTYEVTGTSTPLLVLRKNTRTKETLGDIGIEATTTIEAWPLGVDLKQKPRYSVTVAGTDCQTLDSALLVVSRGLEEVAWWSVYKVADGARLFDTYVPLVRFSIARDTETLRYAGLEVAADDAADARLKQPRVVGVVTYASAERVIREALITSDDSNQASQLRSFADETREVGVGGRESAHSLKISFSQAYPSAPNTVTVTIPIVRDDLDLAHVEAPARIHVAAWKR